MGDYRDYNEDVQRIKSAILFSQHKAAKSVNANELELYMAIGSFVSLRTRTQAWGHGAIEAVSSQLQKELPGLRGFSPRNLRLMRTFYEEWSPYLSFNKQRQNLELTNSDTSEKESALVIWNFQIPNHGVFPIAEFLGIGFTQHRWILSLAKDLDERLFYIKRAAHEHYRVEDLKRSIRNDDYRHQGQIPNNFLETMPTTRRALRAIETFKDEYLLDYINVEELGVRDAADIDERVVEQAIVNNVKNFIMTFGRGFSFIGNAYHLDAFGEDQFIDLLFFNRDLNCLVAVELKRGRFKPAYLGQLSGYLSVLDEFERKPHEVPSIGIVLCKDMNEAFVNLVIRNYNSPMGVATYTTAEDVPKDVREALPDIDDLKALLEGEDG